LKVRKCNHDRSHNEKEDKGAIDGYGHGRSNCQTLFVMEQIPSDNHVRDMLDSVKPECFHPLFAHALEVFQTGGGLTAFFAVTC
jgi:hypothetical protein